MGFNSAFKRLKLIWIIASLFSGLVVVFNKRWPPSSPNFIHQNFYLWGRLACLMYQRSITRRQTLRSVCAALTVCNTPLSHTHTIGVFCSRGNSEQLLYVQQCNSMTALGKR